MAAQAQTAEDEDTTQANGEVDPQDVQDAQADAAQTTVDPRGKARATQELDQFDAANAGQDPAQASLIAQYGLNAKQARAILQRARDTLQQNAPQQIDLAAAQHMSNPGGWGNLYASSVGAAADKQQEIQQQLMGLDMGMNQADQGSLGAQLALLKQRYSDQAKIAPAAMRVLGLPDATTKPATGAAAQFEEVLRAQGIEPGTPQYLHAMEQYQQKLTHVTPGKEAGEKNDPDTVQNAAMVTLFDPARMRDYASFGQSGQDARTEINNAQTALMKSLGMKPQELTQLRARAKAQTGNLSTLTKQDAQLAAADGLIHTNGDRILQLVNQVDSTGVPMFEGFLRSGKQAIGAVDPAELKSVLTTFQSEVARQLSGNPNMTGVVSDSLRHEIETMAPGNMNTEQAKRIINRLYFETAMRRHYVNEQLDRSARSTAFGDRTDPSAAPSAGAAAPAAPNGGKPMPSGPKLDAYAKAHFGGDAAKATEFLKSQGYQ